MEGTSKSRKKNRNSYTSELKGKTFYLRKPGGSQGLKYLDLFHGTTLLPCVHPEWLAILCAKGGEAGATQFKETSSKAICIKRS
jgi:hypothetical protein